MQTFSGGCDVNLSLVQKQRIFSCFLFIYFLSLCVFRKTLERLVIFADMHLIHLSYALELPRARSMPHSKRPCHVGANTSRGGKN